MADKVKVLLIVTDFYQAGTERFTYELDRAIDKSKFEVQILSLLPLNNSPQWKDYYYEKHLELGTRIYFLDDVKFLKKATLAERIKFHILSVPIPDDIAQVQNFLKPFEAISFLGEYSYPSFKKYLSNESFSKSVIHIMNSVHQKKDLYVSYDKSKRYKFCSGFDDVKIKEELQEFKHYSHHYLPLSINIVNTKNPWHYKSNSKKRIGIFTRLTQHKPLDPFLYSFQLLLDYLPDTELHIYGSGNPEREGMLRYVKQLDLGNQVHFRGHQEDLKQSAQKDELDMVWFHGYYGEPGGFAGFDISSLGIPQVFWDFSNSKLSLDQDIYPMYNHINSFVKRSIEILNNEKAAIECSTNQFNHLLENRDISKHISKLEEIWTR